MRAVYLIKHASPAVQPTVPAPKWQLSERGITEARALGALAEGWGVRAVYSSVEPKASATALLIAEAIGEQVRIVEGFEELYLPWTSNADEFAGAIRSILESPRISVRGAERALDAARRFEGAMATVAAGPCPAVVVTHGRVLTSYLAHTRGVDDPYELWRSIPLAGWTCVDIDSAGTGAAIRFESVVC